jgi:hypothetical protein
VSFFLDRQGVTVVRQIAFVAMVACLAVAGAAAAETEAELEFAAAQERLDEASAQVDRGIARLPRALRDTLGAALKVTLAPARLLTHQASRSAATGFHESMSENVEYAASVMDAISTELDQISSLRVQEMDAATETRLRQLQLLANEAIAEAVSGLDEAIDRSRDSLLRVEEEAEVSVMRVLDRSLVGAIRLMAVMFFLVSLLVAGTRLLTLADRGPAWSELTVGRAGLASLGLLAIAFVSLASLALAIHPESLAVHSARVELSLRPDPCSLYASHQARLARAERIGSARLVELTRDHVDAAQRDCLGAN